MAVTLERQLSEDEKDIVLARFGRKCFATNHDIPEGDEIQFDHIKAFALNGESEIYNIAPMCPLHNKQKGKLSLGDFRVKLRMDNFFSRGQTLTLKDELQFFKEEGNVDNFGESVFYVEGKHKIIFEYDNKKEEFNLYECPITKWKYFYAILPVTVINSDDDEDDEIGLQPRYLLKDKVFELYRHFQKNTVLHPSIARLYKNKVLIFDGQHKIAALLWDERKSFEIKIYINPDPKILNITNISAHDKFAQTRFFSSIMVAKLGSKFGKQFEEYKLLENGEIKTEYGFVIYVKNAEQLTNYEINKQFTSFLFESVLDESKNNIVRLVSKTNRSSDEYPLTIDLLNKSLFSNFIYKSPTEDDLTSNAYKRDLEISNVIRLCNIINDEILHRWDPTKSEKDLTQNKLNRMFRSKSIMAWSEILRDAIIARLEIVDSDEKLMIFYREITEGEFNKIQFIIRKLISWNVWESPTDSDIDRKLADNKSEVKKYFKEKGLTVSYLLGASE